MAEKKSFKDIDWIGAALRQLGEDDQAIIVAGDVCGLADDYIRRIVPGPCWAVPHGQWWRADTERRMRTAHQRLHEAIQDLTVPTERIRAQIVPGPDDYARSPVVRQICDRLDIRPGMRAQCAAPGCSQTWELTYRQRRTCSDACRTRLSRHRRR